MSRVPRYANRNPLFQVMFMFQDANDTASLVLNNMQCSSFDIPQDIAMFDLTFNIYKNAKGISLSIQYNKDLYTEDTIKRVCENFEKTLNKGIEEPETSIDKISILGKSEQEFLKSLINPRICYPNESLISLFNKQVEETPHNTAVSFCEEKLSYYELKKKSECIASNLLIAYKTKFKENLKKGTPIGICAHRNIDLVPAILGVLKAGGCYVPMDPGYPVERLKYILQDSGIPIILSQSDIGKSLNFSEISDVSTIYMDTEDIWKTAIVPLPAVGPEWDAYILYTSGSTGTPKGVIITHRNVVNLVSHFISNLNTTPKDRFFSLTSISFDIYGLELYLPLLVGAEHILCPQCAINNPEELSQLISEHNPTLIQATPSTYAMIVDYLKDNSRMIILSGGEPINISLAQKLLKKGKTLINVYGPTETTIWSTFAYFNGDKDVSIGQPIQNTQCYILDRNFNHVPIGVPGELYISGDGVAREYHNNPALTKERFLKDIHIEEIYESKIDRLYKTGDVVVLMPDKNIKFMGRNDSQVKIRGYRIDLGDIESHLSSCKGIKDCIVCVSNSSNNEKTLLSYVIAVDNYQLEPTLLREELMKKIPNYMVPEQFIKMDIFPRTPNGKIDRKALQQSSQNMKVISSIVSELDSDLQREIASIWKEFLMNTDLSKKSDFFSIGGHSLLVPQVVALINKTYSSNLTIRQFMENPTIEGLELMIMQNYKIRA